MKLLERKIIILFRTLKDIGNFKTFWLLSYGTASLWVKLPKPWTGLPLFVETESVLCQILPVLGAPCQLYFQPVSAVYPAAGSAWRGAHSWTTLDPLLSRPGTSHPPIVLYHCSATLLYSRTYDKGVTKVLLSRIGAYEYAGKVRIVFILNVVIVCVLLWKLVIGPHYVIPFIWVLFLAVSFLKILKFNKRISSVTIFYNQRHPAKSRPTT